MKCARSSARELLNLRSDPLQNADEPLAVARADDAVEIALVRAGATRELAKRLSAGRRHIQPIGTTVVFGTVALDQSAPHQGFNHRRQARLVAAIGERQRRLADARVARDQRQRGKTARTFAYFLRENA
jgi:hypothetical protein